MNTIYMYTVYLYDLEVSEDMYILLSNLVTVIPTLCHFYICPIITILARCTCFRYIDVKAHNCVTTSTIILCRTTMTAATAIYYSLRGKTVLITGGAEGIGAAAVKLFALQGCKVIFLDIARESAQKTIDEVASLSKEGHNDTLVTVPTFYFCNVADLSELQSTTAKILEEHDVIDVLVNNAAATGNEARTVTGNVTPESWELNISTNLRHVFFLSQAIIPVMKKARRGSIVNLGSISWRIPAAGQPVYAACKAAIMGLTRVQSKEVGPANIRINSVMPGAIATQRQITEVLTPEYRAQVMEAQSLKRDLIPEDVAKVIVFLASDEASGVTGSTYVVDGGWCSDP
ncbi:hypothetical protein F5884DRAFT_792982 [Xylogone sp. PMI_703]|nr:hypothetical protein F5884DRAFT_792982 [Xylogone sp. PMI_703]